LSLDIIYRRDKQIAHGVVVTFRVETTVHQTKQKRSLTDFGFNKWKFRGFLPDFSSVTTTTAHLLLRCTTLDFQQGFDLICKGLPAEEKTAKHALKSSELISNRRS